MDPNFINPNYHVILIHFPLALFTLGTFIELFAFLWRTSTFRIAGRWMILIGALSMLPALGSGTYALSETDRISDEQWHLLTDHVIQQSAATAVAVTTVVLWLALSDRNRRRLHWPLMLLVLLANALQIAGAWHGGEMVYQHGTNVAVHDTDARQPDAADSPATQQSVISSIADRGVPYLIEPLDGHLIFAGVAVAFACVGIGLAYRQAAEARQAGDDVANADNAPVPLDTPISRARPARFWLLAVVSTMATASFGYSYLADATDAWANATATAGPGATFLNKVGALSRDLFSMAMNEYARRAIHAINGVVLVLLMLALAFLAWRAPRRTGWLTTVVGLLLLSLAVQGWLGVLLLYEGPEGPVTGWQESAGSVKITTTE